MDDHLARGRVRAGAGVLLGGRGSGQPDRVVAFPAGAEGRRDPTVRVDADGTGPVGLVTGHRPDAGQGAEDRVRADARVRAQHHRHA